MKYQLRPYQLEAVDGARARHRAGSRAVLIVAPTGAGKTIIASHIVEQSVLRGSRTLFLAHRKELIEQCSAKLDDIGVWHGIIKAGNNKVHPGSLVQVASVQTLGRRLERLTQDYRLIIIDEAHHATAKSYQVILDANPQALILGLTATPYRADGQGLGDLFQSYVEVATIEGLVRQGFLVPQRVFVGMRLSLNGVKTTAGDYNLGELGAAVNKPKLVGDIVGSWRRHAADRLTICFATSIEHSRAIVEAFRDAGVAAEHLDGTTPEDERTAILARFAAGQTRVVSNCAVLTEGWDCPQAAALILARPTKSRGLWRQMAGRVLRPYPGKTDCLVLDHGNCTDHHGYLTDPDRVDLSGKGGGERPAPTRKCKQCGARYAGAPKWCPACGVSLETEGGRLDEEITLGDRTFEMVEVQPQAKRVIPETVVERLLLADLQTAAAKGYKAGWAAMRYKSRTGRWPAREMIEAAQKKVWGTATAGAGFGK